VFIKELFTVAKLQNQSGCPSTNEQIEKNTAYIHNGALFNHKEE
jgi:hypothetical protein